MNMTTNPNTDPERIRVCLDRVLASRAFEASPKLKHFLRFVVEAKLAGQGARIKAYTIGVEVFGRSGNFDADADAIVRVNASRLRGLLRDYYAGPGREDPIRFRLPKGGYLPEFADHPDQTAGAPGGFRPTLLAVERLSLVGGPPEDDYLAAGLTDELVTHLSGYGDGMVVVRAPTDGAAGEALAPWSGIAYQLRGGLRRDADRVRTGFTLIDAGTGCVAWSETFDFRFSSQGLFEAQEQVARNVASRILDPHGALCRSLKRQPAALLGTSLALFHYHDYQERFSPQTHLLARTALEAAVREEPSYAEAWAALATCYLGEALFGFNQRLPASALMAECLDAAHRAVALDPHGVMAQYTLALVLFYARDRDGFIAAAQQALQMAPHHPTNLAVVGMHLALAGQWERGLALVRKAMGLNPFHPVWYHLVFSLAHLHRGEYHEALAVLGRFARLDFFPFQINLAVIHGHLGNRTEAGEALRHMFALWPEARQRMDAILNFWFPCEDMAAIFARGLTKARFPRAGYLDETTTESGVRVGGRSIDTALP